VVTAVAFQDLVLDRAAARVDPPADAVAAAAQHEPPANAAAAQHEAPALAAQQEPSSWLHLLSSLGSTSWCSRSNWRLHQKGKGAERNKQAKEIGGR